MSRGASTPPEVPEPSETIQMTDLTSSTPAMMYSRDVALQQRADGVVADAEGLREDESAEADDEAADCGPPHPVNRQAMKSVFRGVDAQGEQCGEAAGEESGQHAAEQAFRADKDGMRGNGKERSEAEDVASGGAGGGAGQGHGDRASRLPFEEQQFDGEQHRGDGRGEGGRHSGGRAGYQQCFALDAGEMEELRDHRAERAAGHDDRAFGAERSAGADGDRRGERLEDRQARLNLAAVDQDGFDGFRECRGRGCGRNRSAP